MKRILSLLLSVVMLVSAMSLVDFSAFAGTYEDYEYTVSADNSVQITKYNGSANTLVIPSAIDGKAVRSIGYEAFAYCNSLTSVVIPDSVTSLADWSFYGCMNLASVTIGGGVKSISNSAFSCCINLKNITIPRNVSSIGSAVFLSCNFLSSINVVSDNNYFSSIDGVLFNKIKLQ